MDVTKVKNIGETVIYIFLAILIFLFGKYSAKITDEVSFSKSYEMESSGQGDLDTLLNLIEEKRELSCPNDIDILKDL